MGNDSWNIAGEEALASFGGLILSPVNDSPDDVTRRLASLGARRAALDVVLDPQLYKPRSDRGQLTEWAHVANDLDTADLSSQKWWNDRCALILQEARRVGANSIASPALLPRTYDDDYYTSVISCSDHLTQLAEARESILTTAIIRLPEIARVGAAERIASILTQAQSTRVYLVFYDDNAPRAQRTDAEALAGGLALIKELRAAGMDVLVAFTGLDMILWKAAGANHAASGKFFNLRQFVPERWEDPGEGGRQLPYWTEQDLLTWLREDDLRLLLRLGLIDRVRAIQNPYAGGILDILDARTGDAWLAQGWRQYMFWFQRFESLLESKAVNARDLLLHADTRWQEFRERKMLLRDPDNDGSWVRSWVNALALAGL
jgi:hypothetical protein